MSDPVFILVALAFLVLVGIFLENPGGLRSSRRSSKTDASVPPPPPGVGMDLSGDEAKRRRRGTNHTAAGIGAASTSAIPGHEMMEGVSAPDPSPPEPPNNPLEGTHLGFPNDGLATPFSNLGAEIGPAHIDGNWAGIHGGVSSLDDPMSISSGIDSNIGGGIDSDIGIGTGSALDDD